MAKKFAPLLIVLAGCMWGTISLFVIYFDQMQITDNIAKLFIRCFGAVLILSIFVLFYNKSLFKFKLKDIWVFILNGLIGACGFNVLFYHNIATTSVNFATVLLYTSPVWVTIISAIIFKEKVTSRKLVGLILCVIGCAFVSGLIGGLSGFSVAGLLIGLGSGLGYGLYTIFTGVAIRRGYEALTINIWTFFFATIGCLIIGVDFGQLGHAIAVQPAFSLGYMLLYAAISSAIPFALYNIGLKYVEGGKAAIMAAVDPVVGTIGALILFGQMPTVYAWIGMALVIAALVILNLPQRKKEISL